MFLIDAIPLGEKGKEFYRSIQLLVAKVVLPDRVNLFAEDELQKSLNMGEARKESSGKKRMRIQTAVGAKYVTQALSEVV